MCQFLLMNLFFFFNDTATTEIYTLSLHDALPICGSTCAPATRSWARCVRRKRESATWRCSRSRPSTARSRRRRSTGRSEEHTSELQSLAYLVCRLLLEKKNKTRHAKVNRHRYLAL